MEEYKNPIIFKDYSDPDVIEYNDKYYMIASSFNHFPGLPLLESNDLVHWNLKRYIINSMEGYDNVRPGEGVWAPSIRYFNDLFYIFIPFPDEGIFVITSKDLETFSPIKNVYPLKGLIDPCPIFKDGYIYCAVGFAKSRIGFNSKIGVFKLDLDLNLVEEYKIVFDGTDVAPTIEGPKFYERNGYFYILAPAGSVETGWQVALRSKNIYGPYEMKIVMLQGDRPINGPHQGALVNDYSNNSWFIHFQDLRIYGRIINLEPVRWINDWPIIGEFDSQCGRPVLKYSMPVTKYKGEILKENYYFKDKLSLEYQFLANPLESFYEIKDNLILNGLGYSKTYFIKNMLLRKLDRKSFVAKTRMKTMLKDNSFSGMILYGMEYSLIAIKKIDNDYHLIVIKGNEEIEEIVYDELFFKDAYFKLEFKDGYYKFYYSYDDVEYIPIMIEFKAVKGKWTGSKLGLLINGLGCSSFDYLTIEDL